jgi:DNA-binding winged helix-turn-helix (wHTH) protein/tetratricopeptide (TPR) repeat protein/energy-coupling factor transporter ATP-binding protein EcfA2
MGAVAKSTHFRLGEWLVIPQECRLVSDGASHAIEPKLMDVLVFLCERAGEVVSAEELLIALWRGSYYGDNPVHKSIAHLRRFLGDSATQPSYIATIRKRGYQVVAKVNFSQEYVVASAPVATWPHGNPYPGLGAFKAGHQAVFFGRNQARAALLSRLQSRIGANQGFVLLLGPSGSGKTSLLQAGILPLLTQPYGFDGLCVTAVGRIESAHIVDSPAHALATAMLQWRVAGEPLFHDSEREWIVSCLYQDMPVLLASLHDRWQRHAGHASTSQHRHVLLLLLDQLERAFAIQDDATASMNWLFERVSALLATGQVAALASCRNDFYPDLVRVRALEALKADGGQFDLAPLSAGEIAQIIRAPARAAGLSFEHDPQTGLRLDDLLRDAATKHPQSLPLLQHILSLLYEKRSPAGMLTFAAYRDMGGFDGALAQQAERAFSALPAAAQNRLPQLLRKMVSIGDDERSPVGHLVPWTQIDSADELALVQAMVDHRLFASELLAGTPAFSAAHESLFRQWPRIGLWIGDNQRMLLVRSRVAQAVRRWTAEGEKRDFLLPAGGQLDDAWMLAATSGLPISPQEHRFVALSRRRARRQRRLRVAAISGLVLLGMVAGVAGLIAARQRQEALTQRAQAESLVEFMLGKLTDSLRPLGKLALLDAVSSEAMTYLSTVPETSSSLPVALMRERALRQIAEIRLDRGDVAGATVSFERAASLSKSITTTYPDNADAWFDYGNALFWLGQISYQAQHYDAASKYWNGYLQAGLTLNALHPTDGKAIVELSYAYNNLATLAFREGQYAQARAQFTRSLELKQRALQLQPADASVRADMADTLSWLGTTDEAGGDLAAAAASYAKALALLDALHSAAPEDQRWRYLAAGAATHLGDMRFAQGQLTEAATAYGRAHATLHDLCAVDPENHTWARDAIYASMKVARVDWYLNRTADAKAQMANVNASLAQVLSLHAPTKEDKRLEAQVRLVALELADDKSPEARRWLDQSIDALDVSVGAKKSMLAAAQAHLLARLLVARAATDGDSEKSSDLQRALRLLDQPNMSGNSNAIEDLKVRALVEAGQSQQATLLIEQLAMHGYKSPDYLLFLETRHKGKS